MTGVIQTVVFEASLHDQLEDVINKWIDASEIREEGPYLRFAITELLVREQTGSSRKAG